MRPRFLAIFVIGNIDCHEHRLTSLFGIITLLEYIQNLVEEIVNINVETIVLVSANSY